jgi:hypothetical protein
MTEEAVEMSVSREDSKALIGILASLEGLISAGRITSDEVSYFRKRMTRDGVIGLNSAASDDATADVETGLGELILRMRRSLGETR